MTRVQHESNAPPQRTVLVALAVCCVVPMLAIIVLTSVVGIALGPAAGISLGLVGALVCVAVMAQHHRHGTDAQTQARPSHVE